MDRLIEEFEPYYLSWMDTLDGSDINNTDTVLAIGEVGYAELMSENPDVRRNAWLMTTANSMHSDKQLVWKKGGYESDRSETVAGMDDIGIRRYTFGFAQKDDPSNPSFVYDSRHPAWMRPVDFYNTSAESTLTKEKLERYRALLKESQQEWDSICLLFVLYIIKSISRYL